MPRKLLGIEIGLGQKMGRKARATLGCYLGQKEVLQCRADWSFSSSCVKAVLLCNLAVFAEKQLET